MDLSFRIRAYLNYWLDAVDEHSLHSPFLYELYREVIRPKNHTTFPKYESLREQLKHNNKVISYQDLGAKERTVTKKIKEIAKGSLSDEKYSLLYYRLIKYFNPEFIIDLGTSLGLNTLYLSEAGKQVYTFEGISPLISIANSHFQQFDKSNIKIIEGNIDHTLPEFLQSIQQVPFIFFDANHTYNATKEYFEQCLSRVGKRSVFIFDDINWSKDMNRAWCEIQQHPEVTLTLNLYRCGIVFFDKSLKEQHFSLRY